MFLFATEIICLWPWLPNHNVFFFFVVLLIRETNTTIYMYISTQVGTLESIRNYLIIIFRTIIMARYRYRRIGTTRGKPAAYDVVSTYSTFRSTLRYRFVFLVPTRTIRVSIPLPIYFFFFYTTLPLGICRRLLTTMACLSDERVTARGNFLDVRFWDNRFDRQ